MLVQPYLFFDGRCEEAIGFYQKALGARVEMMLRYKEAPEQSPDMLAGYGDKVMYANLRIGDGSVMMADDCMGHPVFNGFQLSLSVADETEAKTRFAALSDGGQVKLPLTRTFFSPCFGMATDRFGVSWMVIVAMPGN